MAATMRLSIVHSAKSTFVIDDFSTRDYCSWSSEFSPSGLPKYNFQLCVIPKNNLYATFTGDVLFNLWTLSPQKPKMSVQYRVSILDAHGEKHCTKDAFANYGSHGKHGKDYSIIGLVPRDYLLNYANLLLPGDKLTIYCEIDVLSHKIRRIPETALQPVIRVEDEILKNFRTLLENGKFSDVVLMVGKRQFNVHKSILAASSKVFGAMFENKQTKESRENRVEIPDVDGEVFEQLLSYIYSGSVAKLDEYALELFIAADKYQLKQLKSICAQFLSSNLTVDTVASILLFADMHSAPELKEYCVKFITENSVKVRATDGWLVKTRIELLAELYEDLSRAHSGSALVGATNYNCIQHQSWWF